MTLSGLLYMTGITFYLRALQGHEASMVAPFFQSSPMFGYILAYLVLGETLTRTQLLGGALDHRRRAVRCRSARPAARALPLAACRFDAVRGFVHVAVDADLQGVRPQGRVLGNHVLDVRRRGAVRRRRLCASAAIRRQFIGLCRSNGTALLAINASNELINLGGGLANRYALIFAPLAVVQAIGSTTTLFVFLFGVLLTLALPSLSKENLSAREFIAKGIAAVLVAVGVTLVSR